MGTSPQTTNSNQSPPPQVLSDYQGLVNRAVNTANTPYTPYGGEMVAPLSGQTSQGLGAINQYAGAAQPYISQAAGMARGAAAPVSPMAYSGSAMGQFMNPYTSSVVGATQAELNNQNQQQAQFLNSQNIGAGAFGGDRAGISQGILANQQDLAEAPTIAGLNQSNWNQAMAEFNTQQQTQLGAGQWNQQNLGNLANVTAGLGSLAQNTGLTGAQAQTQAGMIPQAEQQAIDTALQQLYSQGQTYPFQTTGWLGNIVQGVGSQEGGTATTSAPGPAVGSQVAGAGLAGLGALSSGPGIGANLAAMMALLPLGAAHGGRIPRRGSFAFGGGLPMLPQSGRFNPTQFFAYDAPQTGGALGMSSMAESPRETGMPVSAPGGGGPSPLNPFQSMRMPAPTIRQSPFVSSQMVAHGGPVGLGRIGYAGGGAPVGTMYGDFDTSPALAMASPAPGPGEGYTVNPLAGIASIVDSNFNQNNPMGMMQVGTEPLGIEGPTTIPGVNFQNPSSDFQTANAEASLAGGSHGGGGSGLGGALIAIPGTGASAAATNNANNAPAPAPAAAQPAGPAAPAGPAPAPVGYPPASRLPIQAQYDLGIIADPTQMGMGGHQGHAQGGRIGFQDGGADNPRFTTVQYKTGGGRGGPGSEPIYTALNLARQAPPPPDPPSSVQIAQHLATGRPLRVTHTIQQDPTTGRTHVTGPTFSPAGDQPVAHPLAAYPPQPPQPPHTPTPDYSQPTMPPMGGLPPWVGPGFPSRPPEPTGTALEPTAARGAPPGTDIAARTSPLEGTHEWGMPAIRPGASAALGALEGFLPKAAGRFLSPLAQIIESSPADTGVLPPGQQPMAGRGLPATGPARFVPGQSAPPRALPAPMRIGPSMTDLGAWEGEGGAPGPHDVEPTEAHPFDISRWQDEGGRRRGGRIGYADGGMSPDRLRYLQALITQRDVGDDPYFTPQARAASQATANPAFPGGVHYVTPPESRALESTMGPNLLSLPDDYRIPSPSGGWNGGGRVGRNSGGVLGQMPLAGSMNLGGALGYVPQGQGVSGAGPNGEGLGSMSTAGPAAGGFGSLFGGGQPRQGYAGGGGLSSGDTLTGTDQSTEDWIIAQAQQAVQGDDTQFATALSLPQTGGGRGNTMPQMPKLPQQQQKSVADQLQGIKFGGGSGPASSGSGDPLTYVSGGAGPLDVPTYQRGGRTPSSVRTALAIGGRSPFADGGAPAADDQTVAPAPGVIYSDLPADRTQTTPQQRAQFEQRYVSQKYPGKDPSIGLGVAKAEGLNAPGAAPSTVDIDPSTGKPFSFQDYQLNTKNGMGVDAMRAGIDPTKTDQWQQSDAFALDKMYGGKGVNLQPWKGDAYVAGQSPGGPAADAISAQAGAPAGLNVPGVDPLKLRAAVEDAARPPDQKQYHPDFGQALMYAGFAMMAGRSPWAAVNIGEGAMKGLDYFQKQQELSRQWSLNDAQIADLRSQAGQRSAQTNLLAQQIGLQRMGLAIQAWWASGSDPKTFPKMSDFVNMDTPLSAPGAVKLPQQGAGASPGTANNALSPPGQPHISGSMGTPASAPAPAPAPQTPGATPAPAGGPAGPGATATAQAETPTADQQAYQRELARLKVGAAIGAADASAQLKTAQDTGVITLPDGKTIRDPDFMAAKAEQERQEKAAAEGGPEMVKMDTSMAESRQLRNDVRQRLQLMLDLNDKMETGALADTAQTWSRYAQYFGIDPKNATNYQLFRKYATQEIYKELKEQKGQVRNMEITGYTQQVANPENTNSTNRHLLLQALGGLDYQDKFANDYYDWRKTPGGQTALSQGPFQNDWLNQKGHDPNRFFNKQKLDYATQHYANANRRPPGVPSTAHLQNDPDTLDQRWYDPGTKKAWDFDGASTGE